MKKSNVAARKVDVDARTQLADAIQGKIGHRS